MRTFAVLPIAFVKKRPTIQCEILESKTYFPKNREKPMIQINMIKNTAFKIEIWSLGSFCWFFMFFYLLLLSVISYAKI